MDRWMCTLAHDRDVRVRQFLSRSGIFFFFFFAGSNKSDDWNYEQGQCSR